ncbi:MAG: hypothetical protein PHC29_05915 [Candidatus Omnitrophica bacterium]|nr:hypothetical protein [Candidatus Omnitrophota bacterium]
MRNWLIAAPVALTLISPFYFLSCLSAIVEPFFGLFLILSVFLLYKKKYLLSSVIISLLPVTHQLGVIYAAPAVVYFFTRRKYNYCLLILLPSLLWVILNQIILKHGLAYTFFYPGKISPYSRPPENSMLPIGQINPLFFVSFLPMAVFFIFGLINSWIKKENLLINLFILPILTIVIGYNIYLINTQRSFWWEFRYLVPIIPFFSFIVVNGIDYISQKLPKSKNSSYFTFFFILILISSQAMQFFYLENNKRVLAERISPVQEEKLKSVSNWLNNFMNENKIKNLYLLNGGDITDKYVRRIWMYLEKKYNFYCFTKDFNNNDKIELFDTITYKFKEPKEISGVFLHTKRSLNNAFLPAGFRSRMIKEEPEVFLYFFIPDN